MFLNVQKIVIISLFLVITATCILAQSAKDWNQNGTELYKQGKYSEAAKCFDRALERDPESGTLWFNLGNCYYRMCSYEDASRCYGEALKSKPDSDKLLAYKACVLAHLKNTVLLKQL